MLEVQGKIKKWGNSVALRFRKLDLKQANLRLNQ
jgi:antitoxin component of MazEF toxin-antitoxin module